MKDSRKLQYNYCRTAGLNFGIITVSRLRVSLCNCGYIGYFTSDTHCYGNARLSTIIFFMITSHCCRREDLEIVAPTCLRQKKRHELTVTLILKKVL